MREERGVFRCQSIDRGARKRRGEGPAERIDLEGSNKGCQWKEKDRGGGIGRDWIRTNETTTNKSDLSHVGLMTLLCM